MKYAETTLLLVLLLSACARSDEKSDAFGNFESRRTVVAAEVSGPLIRFTVRDGRRLAAGEAVAVVDTTQLVLQRDALRAQRAAAVSQTGTVRAELAVLDERRQIAVREQERFDRLVKQGAAPRKQLDDVSDQIRVIEREMEAVRSRMATIAGEIESIDAQLARLSDQISRSTVVNPIDGVVLETYAEPHELAVAGRPLYEIAPLDTLTLRAYASGGQLPEIRIGRQVDVIVDRDADRVRTLPGIVSWISSEAEFTPKLIQTREERVDLVYAFEVRVANPDGSLKIGMPGEVRLPTTEEDAPAG